MASHAKSSLLKNISQQLTCSICLEHYNIPKTITCLHTFCQECLQETIDNNAITNGVTGHFPCPKCRSIIKFDCRDLATKNIAAEKQFRTNFDIQSQLDVINSKISSGCPEHEGEELMFFCHPCDRIICPLCLGAEHMQHGQLSTVEEAAWFIRAEFENEQEKISKKIGTNLELWAEHKRHSTQLEKIKCTAEDMIECLDSCKAEIKDFIYEVRQKEQISDELITDIQDKNQRLVQIMSETDDLKFILQKETTSALLEALKDDIGDYDCTTDINVPSEDRLAAIFERFSCYVKDTVHPQHKETSNATSSLQNTKLTKSTVSDATLKSDKYSMQAPGATLYQKVVKTVEQIFGTTDIAEKVTGLLLEENPKDIQHLIASSDMLVARVEECLQVLIALSTSKQTGAMKQPSLRATASYNPLKLHPPPPKGKQIL